MKRFNVEQMQGNLRGVSDDELTRLIDTVKVKPPLSPARTGMSQGPVRSSPVTEALVRNLRKKWGRMG
jgi:hypothetical protein